ncbi:mitochondrial K+-H+ exchange-related-domain-containing protein [Flagelloscypha sp. PMI_526]|nr:mitochondrial K+-H+ exchange-related-domain-containing protein [Flagelloscypha sp. PMI_526]
MTSLRTVTSATRIIALPLTRPRTPNTPPFTFYHFNIVSQERATAPKTALSNLATWGSSKVANLWASFGKAEEGTWRTKVYAFGQGLFDRVEFEEFMLKSFDTSIAPLPPASTSEKHDSLKVSLIHPPSLQPELQLSRLRTLAENRIPMHRRGFWTYLAIVPFTFPLKFIPIIPNLPFFYCSWRSWHHWRALRSADYVRTLLDNNIVVSEESHELDMIYKDFAPKNPPPSSTSSEVVPPSTTDVPEHDILLTKDAVPAIASLYGMGTEERALVYRALAQATARVKKGKV